MELPQRSASWAFCPHAGTSTLPGPPGALVVTEARFFPGYCPVFILGLSLLVGVMRNQTEKGREVTVKKKTDRRASPYTPVPSSPPQQPPALPTRPRLQPIHQIHLKCNLYFGTWTMCLPRLRLWCWVRRLCWMLPVAFGEVLHKGIKFWFKPGVQKATREENVALLRKSDLL